MTLRHVQNIVRQFSNVTRALTSEIFMYHYWQVYDDDMMACIVDNLHFQ